MHLYKRIYLLFILVCITSVANAQDFNWGFKISDSGEGYGRRVRTDAENNIYVLGCFKDTLIIQDGSTPVKVVSVSASKDIFLIKYNCNKEFQWKVIVGGSGEEGSAYDAGGMEIDKNGDIIVTSSFEETAHFTSSDNSNIYRSTSSTYSSSAFTMRVSPLGIINWIAISNGGGSGLGTDVAIGDNGDIYITGQYTSDYANSQFFTLYSSGSADASPSTTLASNTSYDVFVAKYDASGGFISAHAFDGPTFTDNGNGLIVDGSGNIYVCGGFGSGSGPYSYGNTSGNAGTATINFGNSVSLTNTGDWGAFLVKLNSSYVCQWAVGIGSIKKDAFSNLVLDRSTNKLFVIGHSSNPSSIVLTTTHSSTPTTLNNAGGFDIVIACIDATNGGINWAKNLGGDKDDMGYAISLDLDNSPLFGGTVGGTANFDGKLILNPTNKPTIYVTKFSSSGNFINIQRARGSSGASMLLSDITTSPAGVSYITGLYSGTLNLSSKSTLKSYKSTCFEPYVARYFPYDTTIITANKYVITCSDSSFLTIVGKQAKSYQWLKNNKLIPGATKDTLIVKRGGSYSLVAYNDCLSPDTSNVLVITNNDSVTVVASKLNINICNDSALLYLKNTNSTPVHWYRNDTLITGTVNDSMYVSKKAKYKLVVYNACGNLDTSNIVLIGDTAMIYPSKLIIGLCKDSTLMTIFSRSALSYQWFKNDTIITGATNDTFYAKSYGAFKLVINEGCNKYDTTNVVNIGKDSTKIFAERTNIVLCGDSVLISALNLKANSFKWMKNNTMLNYTNDSIHIKYKGDYKLVVYDSCGNADTSNVITITGGGDKIRLDAGPDQELCPGDTSYLNTSYSGNDFTWSPTIGLANPTNRKTLVTPMETTVYKLTVVKDGCTNEDTVTVKISKYFCKCQ